MIVTPESNFGQLSRNLGAGLQVRLEAEEVAQGLVRAILGVNYLDRCRRGVEQLRRHRAWERVAEDYIMACEEPLCAWAEPHSIASTDPEPSRKQVRLVYWDSHELPGSTEF